ncbi:urokinase plasminogen activator surface receptor-like [Tachysurus fulvidraco]|uniref:urokinase plasminogen activator surface receptor-like n=1 Tax=Tachysurus fulvidraco TaxID=1234273 RepID=UPI001FEDF7D8|nr:urokinase plasminogen activator surface receptor-like [Tachysurus fulvidraco]
MKIQVSLLLTCMLFSKALSLNCYQCLSAISECTNEQITCPDQCLAATTSVYLNGAKISESNMKTCGVAEMCISGSMNLGMMKVANNAKCCTTNLCNSETIPAPAKQVPNGKKCYTCDKDGCSATLNCEGNEERCISASVQQASNTIPMKGCVSKSFCDAAKGQSMSGMGVSNFKCCEGNFCNGAEIFTLSFLLMIVPLITSILFS